MKKQQKQLLGFIIHYLGQIIGVFYAKGTGPNIGSVGPSEKGLSFQDFHCTPLEGEILHSAAE